jgi:hypothetical protein
MDVPGCARHTQPAAENRSAEIPKPNANPQRRKGLRSARAHANTIKVLPFHIFRYILAVCSFIIEWIEVRSMVGRKSNKPII